MSFNQRVSELLKEKKMTKMALAKASGIPYTTLDSMLKRDSETARLTAIFKIADALGTSVEELVFEKAEKTPVITSEEKRMLDLYSALDVRGRETAIALLEKEAEHSIRQREKKKNVLRRLPVYEQPAAAGLGLYIQNDEKKFELFENVPKSASFGIRVKGDSMEPRIKNGDIVFVSDTEEIGYGEIGIFVLNGESLCKKYVSVEGITYLESLNPAYSPIKVLETDEMKFVGKVVGSEGKK